MENSIIPTHVLTQSTNNQLDTYKQLDIPDNNKAKKALLKTIIEKNNLTPTTPLLDYTEKETQSDLQKAIYIDIDLDNHIKEKNVEIVDRLEQNKNIDTNILEVHHEKTCSKKCIFSCISVGGGIIIVSCLIGGFTFWIMANPCIISSCIG